MALTFPTGGAHIALGSLDALSGAPAMTIATWIRLATTSSDAIIAQRGTTFSLAAPWTMWRDETAFVSGRVNTLSTIVNTDAGTLRVEGESNVLNDITEWHHVALVFEAGMAHGCRLYVDGVRSSHTQSTIGHSNLVVNTDDATIGIASSTAELVGEVAEFTVWQSVLADHEIAQLAAGFSPLVLPAALERLVVYQDLIRDINRPGVGPTVTGSGLLTAAPHPRVFPACSQRAFTSSAQASVAGPYRSAAASLHVATSDEGDTFIPGAASGALVPTGEVHS